MKIKMKVVMRTFLEGEGSLSEVRDAADGGANGIGKGRDGSFGRKDRLGALRGAGAHHDEDLVLKDAAEKAIRDGTALTSLMALREGKEARALADDEFRASAVVEACRPLLCGPSDLGKGLDAHRRKLPLGDVAPLLKLRRGQLSLSFHLPPSNLCFDSFRSVSLLFLSSFDHNPTPHNKR